MSSGSWPPAHGEPRLSAGWHSSNLRVPIGRGSTAAIADRFGFDRVVQLRAGSTADLGRVARLVSGNATGLVLGGGGARGFAHLGVWRALAELGVEVDVIGGASIGAPLGAGMAMRIAPDEFIARAVELFHDLLDYTVPVVSLVKGARITRNIASVFGDIDVRDLWLPFFCVSTNLTRSRVEVHDRRDLATAIRASVAIPGIFPPVPFDGDLLVDGGVLNNLPCDVMRAVADDRPPHRGRPVTGGRPEGGRRLRPVGVGLEGAPGAGRLEEGAVPGRRGDPDARRWSPGRSATATASSPTALSTVISTSTCMACGYSTSIGSPRSQSAATRLRVHGSRHGSRAPTGPRHQLVPSFEIDPLRPIAKDRTGAACHPDAPRRQM